MTAAPIPRPAYEDRLERVRGFMRDDGLQALIIAGRGVISHYGHLWYVTGYCPVVRWAAAVVLPAGAPRLIVPTPSDERLARAEGVAADLMVAAPAPGDPTGYGAGLAQALAGVADGARIGVVGLEEIIPAGEYLIWTQALRRLTLVGATEGYARVKAVKSAGDVAAMRRAAEIADDGLDALIEDLRTTRSPASAAGAAEARVRALGAHEVLVYVSARPDFLHRPSRTPVRDGDLVTAFVEVSTAEGYWVELARLITVGRGDRARDDVVTCAQGAMAVAEESLQPGVTAADSASRIRAFLEWRGARSGLWYGHGVGVDHDLPTIGPDCAMALAPGMTIALHPHIVSPDGTLGASLCETFLIADQPGAGALALSRHHRTPTGI